MIDDGDSKGMFDFQGPEKYITALYYSFTYLTTVGFGMYSMHAIYLFV